MESLLKTFRDHLDLWKINSLIYKSQLEMYKRVCMNKAEVFGKAITDRNYITEKMEETLSEEVCNNYKLYMDVNGGLNAPETKKEVDPSGLTPNSPGAKLDGNKYDADLVLSGFANALIEVCKIGTFGAKKYTRNGWVSVINGEERYRSAGLRHWLEEASSGDPIDPDSKLLHKAHKAWNALGELELYLRGLK